MKRKRRLMLAGIAAVVLGGIQLLPFGRNHSNPIVRAEPQWPSPEARELARRACYDCHSNETRWPWYSHIAPISWLVQYDVDEGRKELNFSEWDHAQKEADEAAEEVDEGEMPPWFYVAVHPDAKLSPTEKKELATALSVAVGMKKEDRD